ncbi:MAG: HD domain-containing phosphohydrolase [Methylomonas sp.]
MNEKPNWTADILVVDDNPANLRLLADMLSQRGYMVRVASSGAQTLKTVAMRQPELILLDINMPGMDGFEVCARLKQDPATSAASIIFLSALNDIEDKQRAFALGGADYITKPFQAEEVLMRVNNQIELSRSRQALQQAYEQMEQRAEAKSRELITVREEQLRIAQQLKNSLEQTINVIAMALEKRDPYTAGHQRNVAEISVAIAERLGADAHSLEGVRLGAIIHDIGKIRVPAEILTRPGRLDEIELGLIKTHPQVGYDIIKGIDFPWPVALMVQQHHERLDGSGYPFGLKGNEIIDEAKIIAVADVIDAMSSHRPYRAAVGLAAAIQEIDMHKGELYDRDVVEAAIHLHREGSMNWFNHDRR